MDSTSHDLYPPLTDDEIQQAFFPSSLALPPAFPPFAPSLQPYTQRHADALLMAPFFPPVSMAPQSHVRSQQTAGADAGAVDTMPRRAPKRRRLDISSESSTTTEINQFRSAQLPLNGSLLAGLMPTDASVSLCCSSCPDGEPCDSPECDDQCEQVVACLEPDCEAPLCTDTCLSQVEPASKTALRDHDRKIPVYIGRHDDEHKVLDEYGNNTVLHDKSLHQSVWQDPLHSLDDGTKDAYTEQDLALLPMNRVSLDSSPFYSSEYSNATVSGTELSSLMDTSTMLHDAVDLFSGVQPTDYPRQCEWDACRAMMNSAQDCFRHIHDFHFDPQITWNCPTGLPACEGFIAGNPLNHLVSEHGWLVASNEEQAQYKCPAPMCQDESIFLDTQQLHHHFDEQHATPTTGELQCQWQTCSTVVENPQDLIAHLVHQHRLPMPTSPKKEEATRNLLPDVKAVAEDNHLACRWCDAEDGHVCGKVCSSETDLHEHVKEHIARLVRNPGFECQWEGCRRNVKPGEKKGFSQRGKLERHMASHTGCKYL